jgi:hypothetical protein
MAEWIHICSQLLMPCESNDEDGGIVSVQDIPLLALSQLVNEAKLEEYQMLVARLAWHPRETYRTLLIL